MEHLKDLLINYLKMENIEILFEDVTLTPVAELLVKVYSESIFLNSSVTNNELEKNINFNSAIALYESIDNSGDGSIYLNFSNFRLNELQLPEVNIQIYKYNRTYDLCFDFVSTSLKAISLEKIQLWSESISNEIDAKIYFCGLEPASDQETRFFTGKNLGPLKWG